MTDALPRAADLWISCDCPEPGGFDFDIDTLPLPGPDDPIYCTCCGGQHRAGDIGVMMTVYDGRVIGLSEEQWRVAVDPAERPNFDAQMPTTSETANA
jgi:hypothetical protein